MRVGDSTLYVDTMRSYHRGDMVKSVAYIDFPTAQFVRHWGHIASTQVKLHIHQKVALDRREGPFLDAAEEILREEKVREGERHLASFVAQVSQLGLLALLCIRDQGCRGLLV